MAFGLVLTAAVGMEASNSPFQGGRHSLGDVDREAGNEKHERRAPESTIVATALHHARVDRAGHAGAAAATGVSLVSLAEVGSGSPAGPDAAGAGDAADLAGRPADQVDLARPGVLHPDAPGPERQAV